MEKAFLQLCAAAVVVIVTLGLVAPALVSAESDLLVILGFVVAFGGLYGAFVMAKDAIIKLKTEEDEE